MADLLKDATRSECPVKFDEERLHRGRWSVRGRTVEGKTRRNQTGLYVQQMRRLNETIQQNGLIGVIRPPFNTMMSVFTPPAWPRKQFKPLIGNCFFIFFILPIWRHSIYFSSDYFITMCVAFRLRMTLNCRLAGTSSSSRDRGDFYRRGNEKRYGQVIKNHGGYIVDWFVIIFPIFITNIIAFKTKGNLDSFGFVFIFFFHFLIVVMWSFWRALTHWYYFIMFPIKYNLCYSTYTIYITK